ncbi:LacI family DNA-binding transcriptional regulator [Arcticibacterium luteifluviistationis]|uniref:LacI family transcriptional regulator n=1 Tax=Arcticibacterium luteifluviistationis TaxID=1784714 RepID=A0A2Z4G8U0_9BACT|nr:LacI family DNA-binding transcriptional regulator [Arcticibacterium luteifluviistationis]AWV97632.1 LacI family transcriptional regulator [Arcticibacterium luteifluviistationis]
METNKVTIHDIAKSLNIDSSTVSRALNDSPRVTQKTKDKILAKAQSMGYQRNMLASNLRKNVTNSIGVVIPRISRHFFSSVIQGIEETAYDAGYSVVICQSLEELKRERNIIQTLVANRVAGVLISISMETTNYEHFQILNSQGIPYVFFDRHCEIPANNNVIINDFKGGYDATQHLVSKGCKNILHFSGPGHLEIYKNRLKGYKKALSDNNILFKTENIISSKLMEQDGKVITKKLMDDKVNFDGIFCANDQVAIGAIKYLNEIGVKIPEQVAIVGFSNEPVSNVITPSLTTIDQPGFEMGIKATELLIKNIKDQSGTLPPETITMETNLIERNSSQK